MTWQPVFGLWSALFALPLLGAGIALALSWRTESRTAWLRRGGIALLALVMALGPSTARDTTSTVAVNADIIFVVDRTGSMAAEDYNGSEPRLDGVSADITEIVQDFPGAEYGIVAWDSRSTRQLPLTSDANAAISWADTLTQELSSLSAGSRLDRPLVALTEMLESAQERNPQNVRLVFLMSDGENTDGDASTADSPLIPFDALEPLVDGGAVLGYGTVEGGTMRVWDGSTPPEEADWIIDPATDEPAVSVIDETNLRAVAEQLAIPYEHRTQPGGLESVTQGYDLTQIAGDGRREVTVYTPLLWPFALAVLGLLAWELFALGGAFPRIPGSARSTTAARGRGSAQGGQRAQQAQAGAATEDAR
ncbi:vWA domain-containing protein [Serinibacter salmoneus]|uniref:Ca-activated chloride channel family protein n=1 Tax=Serinibacter salmoneus TaxID=556530 RepID=A0A2A9D328_9MICO|nr:VWA domain-containing protein [Serinibacter salmoneus]PFG21064.1 Ca-activated chloride channel family protein [Serinibacter salmoneus]